MLTKIIGFIRLKIASGILFELLYLLHWPWSRKNSGSAEKIINPTFNLNLVGNLTDTRGFKGMRGVGLTSPEVFLEHKIFFDLLVAIAKNKGNPRREKAFLSIVPPLVKKIMEDTDILVSKEAAPSKVKYMGWLSEPPKSLAPTQMKKELSQNIKDDDYVVNKDIFLQLDQNIPTEISKKINEMISGNQIDLANIFADEPPILWCIEATTKFICPYQITNTQAKTIAGLIQKTVVIEQLSDDLFNLLIEIEVLISVKHQAKKQTIFEQALSDAKAFLHANNYVVLKNHFNFVHTAWQRQYFKDLVTGGYFMPSDLQVPNRQCIYNETYSRFIHCQLNGLINQVLEHKVKPSYSFLAHYHGGADLEKHIDREQCEWNLSMPLDVWPNTSVENSWPIYIQKDINDENSAVEVKLDIGDCVIYRGSKLYHWRNRLPAEQTATICFFHFVHSDFKGSLG